MRGLGEGGSYCRVSSRLSTKRCGHVKSASAGPAQFIALVSKCWLAWPSIEMNNRLARFCQRVNCYFCQLS